jgi:heme exporter protein D
MQFSSFNEFIAMGGYGFYVWVSYGACVIVMLGLLLNSKWSHQNTLNQVESQMARDARIKKAKEQGL